MKRQLIILLLAALSPSMYANTYIIDTQALLQNIFSRNLNRCKGRVQDNKGNGIEFATVALVDTSGVVIAGTALRQDSDECVGTRCGTDR